jgi:hypothetical protein
VGMFVFAAMAVAAIAARLRGVRDARESEIA